MPAIKLPRGGSKDKASGRSGLKAPKVVGDLYADLRDRRLLPLIALLAVAIVAVPFLLAENDEGIKEASPIVTSKPQPQASFSVVPASTGLREYRKRLGYREARDPFAHGHPSEGSGQQAGTASSPSESSSTGEESNSSVTVEGASEETLNPVSPPAEEAGSGDESSTTKANVVVKNQVIGYGVNASLGFTGHVKSRKEIAPMTKLPNAKNPVVVYVGPNEANTGGVFLMTNNVSGFYGAGHCRLGGQVCQLLELKAGKSASFAYGYGKARYKLHLNKVVPLVSTEKIEAEVTKRSEGSGRGQ